MKKKRCCFQCAPHNPTGRLTFGVHKFEQQQYEGRGRIRECLVLFTPRSSAAGIRVPRFGIRQASTVLGHVMHTEYFVLHWMRISVRQGQLPLGYLTRRRQYQHGHVSSARFLGTQKQGRRVSRRARTLQPVRRKLTNMRWCIGGHKTFGTSFPCPACPVGCR